MSRERFGGLSVRNALHSRSAAVARKIRHSAVPKIPIVVAGAAPRKISASTTSAIATLLRQPVLRGALENSGHVRCSPSLARRPKRTLRVARDEALQCPDDVRRNGFSHSGGRLLRIGQAAGGETARRNDPDQAAVAAQRQQSGGGGLDQLVIAERAVGSRNVVERFVVGAERRRECRRDRLPRLWHRHRSAPARRRDRSAAPDVLRRR